jgi:hypothetical protein
MSKQRRILFYEKERLVPKELREICTDLHYEIVPMDYARNAFIKKAYVYLARAKDAEDVAYRKVYDDYDKQRQIAINAVWNLEREIDKKVDTLYHLRNTVFPENLIRAYIPRPYLQPRADILIHQIELLLDTYSPADNSPAYEKLQEEFAEVKKIKNQIEQIDNDRSIKKEESDNLYNAMHTIEVGMQEDELDILIYAMLTLLYYDDDAAEKYRKLIRKKSISRMKIEICSSSIGLGDIQAMNSMCRFVLRPDIYKNPLIERVEEET